MSLLDCYENPSIVDSTIVWFTLCILVIGAICLANIIEWWLEERKNARK